MVVVGGGARGGGSEGRSECIYRYHSNPYIQFSFRRRARGHVSRERPHIMGDCAAKFHVRVRVVGSFFCIAGVSWRVASIDANPQQPPHRPKYPDDVAAVPHRFGWRMEAG